MTHPTNPVGGDSSLRRDYEALIEALTPSGDTKAAYIGEFKFTREAHHRDGEPFTETIMVPWTTVKEIMAAIRERAALSSLGDVILKARPELATPAPIPSQGSGEDLLAKIFAEVEMRAKSFRDGGKLYGDSPKGRYMVGASSELFGLLAWLARLKAESGSTTSIGGEIAQELAEARRALHEIYEMDDSDCGSWFKVAQRQAEIAGKFLERAYGAPPDGSRTESASDSAQGEGEQPKPGANTLPPAQRDGKDSLSTTGEG